MTKDDLIGRKFDVPGLGSISLLDVMGDDAAVCDAARRTISGARKFSEDRTLIRYMLRHHHGTPFEMCETKLFVEMPLVFKNQMIRHRAASLLDESSMWDEPSVNEFSGRYSEFEDRTYATPPDGWRLQTASNRQGSHGKVTEWPESYRVAADDPHVVERFAIDGEFGEYVFDAVEFDEPATPGHWLNNEESKLQTQARRVYEERLKFGVAREQARKDLPVSQITEFVWKCDLRNVLSFLALRTDGRAQEEIRAFGDVIGREIIAPLFPLCWEAFSDYVLNAVTLSRLDIEAVVRAAVTDEQAVIFSHIENKREREECRAKLVRLGLITGQEV